MTVINTNVKSLVAQNALTVNNRSLSKAMEQLSTGKRINSAADDAAGLAISSKMTSQIKGLNQAVRNANDGISMLQTAEGAMVEVTNMMQRMRELAVQSANDTNTAEDRGYIDLEFQQLKAETNRIVKNTQWNGMNILDGSFNGNGEAGKFKFQVGANADQVVEHTINQLSFSGVATGADATLATDTASDAQTTTMTIASAATDAASADWKVGDVITLKLGSDQLQYTLTDSDVTNVGADDLITIATNIAAAVTSAQAEGRFAGITVDDVGDGTVTFEAASPFATSISKSSGSLASLDGLSTTDSATSNAAIKGVDAALKNVSNARAEIGAKINRLTYAADNLTNVAQNTSASYSQVMDTDYAQATAEMARAMILDQAGSAMLSQANQQPMYVLALLR